jgi:hypothetical protein
MIPNMQRTGQRRKHINFLGCHKNAFNKERFKDTRKKRGAMRKEANFFNRIVPKMQQKYDGSSGREELKCIRKNIRSESSVLPGG